MNILLLYSSLFFGCIQSIIIFNYIHINYNYGIFILFGIFTSIINHGFTHILFKYLDRLTMYIGYIINTIMSLENIILLTILNLSVIFYMLSKKFNYSVIHIFSHLLIIIVNSYIILSL